MVSRRVLLLLVAAALAATAMTGAIAGQAQAALRHIDGTVVSKNGSERTFKIATQGGSVVRIKVTAATRFQRLAGFASLHKGLRIEVDAKRTSDGLVAVQVETRQGGGGGADEHGGGGGADDGPNHT